MEDRERIYATLRRWFADPTNGDGLDGILMESKGFLRILRNSSEDSGKDSEIFSPDSSKDSKDV